MRFRIGTSGFAYAPWKGAFYPADIDDDAMLGFYASKLDAVEINNTFYRMPTPRLLEGWNTQTPEGFGFSVKTPRYITPTAKPSDKGDPIAAFFGLTAMLGPKLGPTLVMLPPFKKKDVPALASFLDKFPRERKLVLEIRSEVWLDDELFDALRARGVTLCVTDGDDFSTPVVATASFGYFRLRRERYKKAELRAWVDRIRGLGLDEAWVFFKHEDAGTGPKLAADLRAITG